MSAKNSQDNRRAFSISKEFEEVKGIIDETKNASRFICEAIIEKHSRDKNPEAPSDAKLTEILEKMGKILENSYGNQNLNELIELKVKEVIQNIITANQLQALFTGNIINPQAFSTFGTRVPQQMSEPQSVAPMEIENSDGTNNQTPNEAIEDTKPITEGGEVTTEVNEEETEERKRKREDIQKRFNNW